MLLPQKKSSYNNTNHGPNNLIHKNRKNKEKNQYLNSRSVHFKLLEDSEGFLIQLIADGDVGYVRGIIVVQSVDVLHDASAVGHDGGQNQQVLQVPVIVHT